MFSFSPSGADALISAQDFLSWIKQEEEPCVRDSWELAEREILTGPGPGEQWLKRSQNQGLMRKNQQSSCPLGALLQLGRFVLSSWQTPVRRFLRPEGTSVIVSSDLVYKDGQRISLQVIPAEAS